MSSAVARRGSGVVGVAARARCRVACVCVTVRAPWSVAGWVLEEQHSSQLEATLRRLDFSVLHCIENRKKFIQTEIRVTFITSYFACYPGAAAPARRSEARYAGYEPHTLTHHQRLASAMHSRAPTTRQQAPGPSDRLEESLPQWSALQWRRDWPTSPPRHSTHALSGP